MSQYFTDSVTGGLLKHYVNEQYQRPCGLEGRGFDITSRKYYEMAFQLFCIFEGKHSLQYSDYDGKLDKSSPETHEESAFLAEQAMRAFLDRFRIFVKDLNHQEILDAQAEEMEELKDQ